MRHRASTDQASQSKGGNPPKHCVGLPFFEATLVGAGFKGIRKENTPFCGGSSLKSKGCGVKSKGCSLKTRAAPALAKKCISSYRFWRTAPCLWDSPWFLGCHNAFLGRPDWPRWRDGPVPCTTDGRDRHVLASFAMKCPSHGCCWETCYMFAYCGLAVEIQPRHR